MFLYGGQNDENLFNDLWMYKNSEFIWKKTDINKKFSDLRKGHSASFYHNKTEEVSEIYMNVNEIINKYNLIVFGGSNGTNYLNDLLFIDITHNALEDKMSFDLRHPTVTGDIPEPREVSNYKILLTLKNLGPPNFYKG